MTMHPDCERVMLTEEQLRQRVKEVALAVDKAYDGKRPLVVGILKGSIIFYSDFIRFLSMPVELDFMAVSSYGSGAVSSGKLKIKKDLESICQVCGEDVSISTHYVQTEAESWSSVIRLDKFFENVKVVSDLNDYIELLKRDRNLIGLDIAKYILTKIKKKG